MYAFRFGASYEGGSEIAWLSGRAWLRREVPSEADRQRWSTVVFSMATYVRNPNEVVMDEVQGVFQEDQEAYPSVSL